MMMAKSRSESSKFMHVHTMPHHAHTRIIEFCFSLATVQKGTRSKQSRGCLYARYLPQKLNIVAAGTAMV